MASALTVRMPICASKKEAHVGIGDVPLSGASANPAVMPTPQPERRTQAFGVAVGLAAETGSFGRRGHSRR